MLIHRPVTRILHRQSGGNDQDLLETAFILRGEQHARDTRVERQAREFPAHVRQFIVIAHRAEFLQQRVAIGDCSRRRRVDERKLRRVPEVQPLGAQDHGGKRRAQHFRVGVLGARLEIVFVVEPDADAVRHAAAAPGSLRGGGTRDFLHPQLLDLVAVAVALDARVTRVDHVANAGHGERCFGHVGGQHDAARVTAWTEHAILFGRRKAGEQWQQFDWRTAPGAGVLA